MRQGSFVVVFALFLTACSVLLAADPPAEHPAKADLIADVAAVQPGQPFHIALRVQMRPDWHIYWIDPGDSGSATQFTFKGPDGWTIEPLPFPTPKKFVMPGEIVNVGYEGTVLFLAKVTPPADARGPAEFSVDAEWLVCNPELCLPGSGSGRLTLPVSSAALPANVELFKTWAGQLPKVIDGPAPAGSDAGHEINVPLSEPAKNVEAFFSPGKGFVLKGVKVTPKDQAVHIQFSSKAVGKDKKPADMVVLIAYDDAGGVRRSVQFTYPLKP